MEAGSKDRPPMLGPGNYVRWKSRIKRYIDTKPNHELIYYCLENPPYELGWKDKRIPDSDGNLTTTTERVFETYKNVTQDIRDQLNAKAEAVQIILIGIDNDIYSTVDAFPNMYEMWKAIERFVTLVKQSQELKTVSYHKLYDILKQHQHEVNEIRAEKIARVANPLALVAQQQPSYHPQTHPTHYNQKSSTRTQQTATRNRGKEIVNSPQPSYEQEPSLVDDDDETSKDKEIDKLMALISLSFKKIYKPTNNNLRTSSNTSRANQDNSLRIHRNTGYESQRSANVAGDRETVGSSMVQKYGIQCYNCKEFRHVARECQKPKRAKDAVYHREKMLLCKQEEARIQLNAEQADWKDDTDDESNDQELEAHYMYMATFKRFLQMLTLSQNKSESIDQNDEDADLAKERELFASLVKKMKSEIEDFNNKNKSLTEANNKLSEKNDLLYADFKKSKAELKRRDSIEYASEMELECAKVRERSRISHINVQNEKKKESFQKQTILLEKRMDESIP
nr:hypothetical protein [Tanacetum cinerariifolium]